MNNRRETGPYCNITAKGRRISANHQPPRHSLPHPPVKTEQNTLDTRTRTSQMSIQDSFAANLKGFGYGLALYHPLRAANEGVGDIAYFEADGQYRRIGNIWESDVLFFGGLWLNLYSI
jgi:hypothetical protein